MKQFHKAVAAMQKCPLQSFPSLFLSGWHHTEGAAIQEIRFRDPIAGDGMDFFDRHLPVSSEDHQAAAMDLILSQAVQNHHIPAAQERLHRAAYHHTHPPGQQKQDENPQ